MELEEQAKVRNPDYKARIEVPCWINKTKTGEQYLSIKLFGTTVNLFKYSPKPKTTVR